MIEIHRSRDIFVLKSATYKNIGQDSFIFACHDSCIGGEHYFDAICLRRRLRKLMRKHSAFHMSYVPSISRLEPLEYVYTKAVMSAADYIETAYSE